MCGTQEPMGSGVPGGTHPNFKNMGSGEFRVPGELGQSGFRWVPGSRQIGPKWVSGSRSEPKKWVPGSRAQKLGNWKKIVFDLGWSRLAGLMVMGFFPQKSEYTEVLTWKKTGASQRTFENFFFNSLSLALFRQLKIGSPQPTQTGQKYQNVSSS